MTTDLTDRTYAEAVAELNVQMERVGAELTARLRPVLLVLAMEMQGLVVAHLEAEPWYRHLRLRWALRRCPRWADQ